jgi:hypothetical protein
MRTILHSTVRLAAFLSGAGKSSSRAIIAVVAAALAIGGVDVHAQTLTEELVTGSLAPAAEEMAAAGVDGSPASIATLVEIAQRHGFGYGMSPAEVRELLGSGYIAVRQIDCSSLAGKEAGAQRLSRMLSAIAWLYAAGAGLTVAAPPVAAALGFGALVAGMSASVAAWLAVEYRAQRSQVRCTKEGGIEWFRPAAPKIRAAADPAISRFSWQRSCGASACA